jgi:hypothetical protein
MGMDVCGRKSRSKAGECFRANCQSWRPLLALIEELCSDLLDEYTLEGLGYNSGVGPDDQKTCTEMARRFEAWAEQHPPVFVPDFGVWVTAYGRVMVPAELAKNPEVEGTLSYKVRDDYLTKWIEFLRDCGGFEVW